MCILKLCINNHRHSILLYNLLFLPLLTSLSCFYCPNNDRKVSFFCISTAHICNLLLQDCKRDAHICGGLRRAANRPRIYAGSITRLQIDRAYMRGGFTRMFRHPAYMRGALHHSAGVVSSCAGSSPSCFLPLLRLGSLIAWRRKYSRSSCIRFTRSAASRRSGLSSA